MHPFLEALDRRVLVCDGAMGTMLYGKGVFVNRSFDELNLTQPDLVSEIHREYALAGADVLETNTFGAHAIKLRQFGLEDRLHAINVEGVRLARCAGGTGVFVAGAVGPLGLRVEPWGKTGIDEAEACFRQQVDALLDGGVDLFILETFWDARELGAAIAAVRQLSDRPIVAQMTTNEDGRTLDGAPPEAFVPELERAGADVVGANCSVGPAAMLETLDRIQQVTNLPLAAQPNAGRPREIEGRTMYLSSPDYIATYARRFVRTGVKLIGGCCGTTPQHVRAIKAAVQAEKATPATADAQARLELPRGDSRSDAATQVDAVPPAHRSRLASVMADGGFVLLAEREPPRGDRVNELVAQADRLRRHGVNAIAVSDGRSGGGRMSALAAAIVIEQQVGIETVLHYECRDRTVLRMQSDLLGAHALGLRNLVIVTGDPLPRPHAPSVGDVDSIGLTNVVARLNRGLDIAGQPIGEPTAFCIGVAANADAVDLDQEVRRFEYKVEAGAQFAVMHPVFDLDSFDRWLERIAHVRIPLVARVRALDDLRDAEFLANEVPGMSVPPRLLQRLAATRDQAAEGQTIARELAASLRSRVEGLQIESSASNVEAIVTFAQQLAAAGP